MVDEQADPESEHPQEGDAADSTGGPPAGSPAGTPAAESNLGTTAEQVLVHALQLFEEDDLEGVVKYLDARLDPKVRTEAVTGHSWALRFLARIELVEEEGEDPLTEAAERALLIELTEPESTLEFLIGAGSILSEEGRHESAEEVLKAACAKKLDEGEHVAVFHLALARQRASNFEAAAEGYARVVALAPEWAQGHLQRSRCLRDLNRIEEAVESLGRYLDIVPYDDEEWITLAILHSGQERWKEADAAYQKAEAIDGDSMLLWFNRGITARRAEGHELLRHCYEKLKALDESDWRSLVLRGYLDEVEGRPWQAWEAFEEATEPSSLEQLDPEDRECTMTHALAYVVENSMTEQTDKLIQRCRETFTFSYDVLDQLRRFGNRHALKAGDYAILIRTELHDEDVRKHMIAAGAKGDEFFCLRNYRVLAESEEAARQAAIDFETGLGARGVVVQELAVSDDVEDVFLGVWWLDHEVHCFAIESEEREAS